MFICTFIIHRELSDLDSDLARRIHQSVRQMIDTEIIQEVSASNVFMQRISMYAEAIERDLQCLGAEWDIHFIDLITNFYKNLLGRDLDQREFGKAMLTFSLFLCEILCLLQDIIRKVRNEVSIMH